MTITVARVEAGLCRLPLDAPIRLGSIVYRTRDYVAVRVIDKDGVEGHALGFSRGVGVIEGLATIAPLVVGQTLAAPGDALRSIRRAFIPGWPGLIRSASLLDIALWDVATKRAGVSIASLVAAEDGAAAPVPSRLPAIAIVGYFGDRRTPESVVEEVAARIEEGHRAVKLVLARGIPRRDEAVLAGIREAFGPGLGVSCDAHWAYADLVSAVAGCRPLLEFGLEFIEDPFPPQTWRLAKELRAALGVPIAHGEDVVGLEGFLDAIDAADVVRIDATSSGGITTALAALDAATAAGRTVLPVIWPGLHARLRTRSAALARVEVIPRETGAELSWQLLRDEPTIDRGDLIIDTYPGVGMDLDWEAVVRTADRITRW